MAHASPPPEVPQLIAGSLLDTSGKTQLFAVPVKHPGPRPETRSLHWTPAQELVGDNAGKHGGRHEQVLGESSLAPRSWVGEIEEPQTSRSSIGNRCAFGISSRRLETR